MTKKEVMEKGATCYCIHCKTVYKKVPLSTEDKTQCPKCQCPIIFYLEDNSLAM